MSDLIAKSTAKAILIPQDVAIAKIHNGIDDYTADQWLKHRRKLTKPEAAAELIIKGLKSAGLWKDK